MLRRDRLLSSLLQVVADAVQEDAGDGYELLQGVRCWIGEATGQASAELARFHVASGDQGGNGKVTPAERMTLAMKMIEREGRITSGELAKACGCTGETARLTLVGMVRCGTLTRVGERRQTFYRLRA